MVLEAELKVKEGLKNPLKLFVVSGIVSCISLLISYLVFEEYVGLFTTFLISLALIPFIRRVNIMAEKIEESSNKRSLIERHRDAILLYNTVFWGVIVFLSVMFVLMPENFTKKVFEQQIREIEKIRGNFVFPDLFQTIFINNLIVLSLTFFFSLLYGFGAVLILTWNATVLASAIGLLSKTLGGAKALPLALLAFFPHGSIEILAYFVGGLAGGIFSTALSKKRLKTDLGKIVNDVFLLYLYAILLLAIAGLIESIGIMLS